MVFQNILALFEWINQWSGAIQVLFYFIFTGIALWYARTNAIASRRDTEKPHWEVKNIDTFTEEGREIDHTLAFTLTNIGPGNAENVELGFVTTHSKDLESRTQSSAALEVPLDKVDFVTPGEGIEVELRLTDVSEEDEISFVVTGSKEGNETLTIDGETVLSNIREGS